MSAILERARETLRTEIAGLEELVTRLGPELEQAVELLHACTGKVVVAGLGTLAQGTSVFFRENYENYFLKARF